jgi:hypothetical protein
MGHADCMSPRRALAAVVIALFALNTLIACGSNPANSHSLVIQFDPSMSDAQLGGWAEANVMTCGDHGCTFRPPIAGAAWDYPANRITLRLSSGAKSDEVNHLGDEVSRLPLVLGVSRSG